MTDETRQPNDRPLLWDDAVIEEVREARRRLWEASGRNIHRFVEQARAAAERHHPTEESRHRDAG